MKSKSGSGQNLCKRLARQTGTENVSMYHIYYECLIRLLNGSLYIKMPFFLVSLIPEPAVWFESVKAIFWVLTITDGQCFKLVWTIAFHQFVCSAHVTSVGKSKKINEKKKKCADMRSLAFTLGDTEPESRAGIKALCNYFGFDKSTLSSCD